MKNGLETGKTIYLDNAATTFPKPPRIFETMIEMYRSLGVSPGRGSYDLSAEAEEKVMEVRQRICTFFGGSTPERVIFSYNATDALNTIIQGLVTPGSHVVSSRLEHNSVLRPLHHFNEQHVIGLDLVPFSTEGFINPDDVADAIRPDTRLVILTHASNVLGTIQPIEKIGNICQEKNVPLILDITQTAGIIPIHMDTWGVSALAFTGHKSLLGPTGIGGLVLNPNLDVKTSRFGGTGKDSLSLTHTESYPYRLEAGTINVLGIFGLSASLDYLNREGVETIFEKEHTLAVRLQNGLNSIKKVHIYGPAGLDTCIPIILFNIEGIDPEAVTTILDGDFGIAARAGLHCAPLVHHDLGTSPKGAIRFSVGPFNTTDEIDKVLEAVEATAGYF